MSPMLIQLVNKLSFYQWFFNLQKGKDFPLSHGSSYLDDGFLDL